MTPRPRDHWSSHATPGLRGQCSSPSSISFHYVCHYGLLRRPWLYVHCTRDYAAALVVCVVCYHTYHNQSAEHPNDLASIQTPTIMISGSWMVSARSCLTPQRICRSVWSVLSMPIPEYPLLWPFGPSHGHSVSGPGRC